MSFAPGQSVTITGLTSKPELNGQQAIIQSFDATSGRYTVLVNSTRIKIKPSNFASGSSPQAQAQAAAQRFIQSYGPLLRRIQNHLPPNMSLQSAGVVVLITVVGLFYFFGFLRTLLVCAALASVMVTGFDAFENAGGGMPGLTAGGAAVGDRISQKVFAITGQRLPWKVCLGGCAVLAFIAWNMLGPSRQAPSWSPPPGPSQYDSNYDDYGDFDVEEDNPNAQRYTWGEVEAAYNQGFADATDSLERGVGLDKHKKKPNPPRRRARAPQHHAPYSPPASPKSNFPMIPAMLLGYNIYTLGSTAGGFDPRMMVANFSNLSLIRKVLIAFLLARVLGISPI